MRVDYPTLTEAATPEYVLEVLRDEHRQQCEYDPEAWPTDLSFDSSVAEWREACDLVAWRRLGRALNQAWEVTISDSTWRNALEPSSSRKLRGVCELLAQHSKRSVVRPARLLGSTCDTAGAFLTVRSLLSDAGAQAEAIRPSTPLAPYARRFPHVFLTSMSVLSPGALPLVQRRVRRAPSGDRPSQVPERAQVTELHPCRAHQAGRDPREHISCRRCSATCYCQGGRADRDTDHCNDRTDKERPQRSVVDRRVNADGRAFGPLPGRWHPPVRVGIGGPIRQQPW